jgi:rhodanese-related sulfurtransferase
MAIKNVFAETNRLKETIVNLSVEDLEAARSAIATGKTLLIDLREIQEVVELGTIPGARHVPRGMLEFWADPASPYYRDFFSEDAEIIVFCAGGGRSVYATLALLDMGYAKVAHLETGFSGWKCSGREILDVSATSKWIRRNAAA